MIDYPVYIINLDSSVDRLAKISAALDKQGASFTRISAYDGRKTNLYDVPEYDSAGTKEYFGRDLNGGEIGCYFSHIRAVRAFLESGAPFGLILEDDAELLPNAVSLVSCLIDWQAAQDKVDWYLCHLTKARIQILSPVAPFQANGDIRVLYRTHYFPMVAAALLWTRVGAQAFLDECLPIQGPVDIFMRKWLLTNDMGVAVHPPLFKTTGAPSEIDNTDIKNRRRQSYKSPLYHARKKRRKISEKSKAFWHMLRFKARRLLL